MTHTQLRQIEKSCSEIISLIEEEIETRENYYEEKSERWQESERGEAYQEKTEKLQNILDAINELSE